MRMESHGGMILAGENGRTRRETCPSDTMSTTNPTWSDPVANPVLRGERPVRQLYEVLKWLPKSKFRNILPVLHSILLLILNV
jgi:hypothetical protein